MNLILFGFPKVGKSYFGKYLAQKLKLAWIDLDQLLELFFQEKVRNLYQKLGEKRFREHELLCLKLLRGMKDTIISVGGGTVIKPTHAAFLKNLGQLVYLKASFETIRSRIFQKELPIYLKTADPEKSLETMFQKRTKIYKAISAISIDVDLLSESGVLQKLERIYQYGL